MCVGEVDAPAAATPVGVDLRSFHAMDVHVAPVGALAEILRCGVMPGADGRTYWWGEGMIDPQGMFEVLRDKGIDPSEAVEIGVPAGMLQGEVDEAMWGGASDAFCVSKGVGPERLYLWDGAQDTWRPLIDLRETLRVFAVLERADLDGMSGRCAAAAIAINEVLFAGKGGYWAAYNRPLLEKAGAFWGHVVVQAPNGVLWDAEGETLPENVEAWGMLDPEDLDYADMYGEGWDEGKAYDAVLVPVDRDFLDGHLDTSLHWQMAKALRDAMEFLGNTNSENAPL